MEMEGRERELLQFIGLLIKCSDRGREREREKEREEGGKKELALVAEGVSGIITGLIALPARMINPF